MSARFTAVFEGETFDIEITSDGELLLPGYEEQLEYEIAYAAMGGEKTLAIVLLARWESSPAEIMCHAINLPREVLIGLAADWA